MRAPPVCLNTSREMDWCANANENASVNARTAVARHAEQMCTALIDVENELDQQERSLGRGGGREGCAKSTVFSQSNHQHSYVHLVVNLHSGGCNCCWSVWRCCKRYDQMQALRRPLHVWGGPSSPRRPSKRRARPCSRVDKCMVSGKGSSWLISGTGLAVSDITNIKKTHTNSYSH